MEFFISFELDGRNKSDNIDNKARIAGLAIEKKINDRVLDKEYSKLINEISIIPNIFQSDMRKMRSERKYISHKKGFADYRTHIDYDKFIKGSPEDRRKLLLRNIIDSVRSIGDKLKKNFDSVSLEKDILDVFNLSYEELRV